MNEWMLNQRTESNVMHGRGVEPKGRGKQVPLVGGALWGRGQW